MDLSTLTHEQLRALPPHVQAKLKFLVAHIGQPVQAESSRYRYVFRVTKVGWSGGRTPYLQIRGWWREIRGNNVDPEWNTLYTELDQFAYSEWEGQL